MIKLFQTYKTVNLFARKVRKIYQMLCGTISISYLTHCTYKKKNGCCDFGVH